MGSIKYYHLANDETPPEEFCAVRDIGGEPSEYMFYVPESEVAKLRELVRDMWHGAMQRMDFAERYAFAGEFIDRMRELEVDE